MPEHVQPLSQALRRLFIEALEVPQPAQCKVPLPPFIVTTLAIGEECYKGS